MSCGTGNATYVTSNVALLWLGLVGLITYCILSLVCAYCVTVLSHFVVAMKLYFYHAFVLCFVSTAVFSPCPQTAVMQLG